MGFKITGLDKLQREIRDAQRALRQLDGTIGTLSFDPDNPTSLQDAIRRMEQMIDSRVGTYRSNPMVSQIVAAVKEQYRQALLERCQPRPVSA
jgi:hypothetical protein